MQLTVNHPSLCRTYGFFELAARVWQETAGETHEEKVQGSVAVLDRLGHWLGGQGITNLLNRLSADIIICDLTGQRPNVFIEAGFALKHHEQDKLIFLFEPNDEADRVPFDLNTFKYVQITQAAEIPNRIGTEIEAILRNSGATLANG